MTDAPIAYILKRYPRFSETFVVNEILAHEAAGQAIEIYALGPVQETHFQEAIARVRAPVRRIRHQYHDTELYWQLLTKAHATLPAFDANAALAENHSAATIGQAAVLALKIHERGIRHLHAHFGTQAATIARLAARFAAVTYSITAHAKDIYHEYSEPVNLARKIANAAFTITVSDYNLAHLREQYPAEAPVYRIYNGLDLEQFPYHAPEVPTITHHADKALRIDIRQQVVEEFLLAVLAIGTHNAVLSGRNTHNNRCLFAVSLIVFFMEATGWNGVRAQEAEQMGRA